MLVIVRRVLVAAAIGLLVLVASGAAASAQTGYGETVTVLPGQQLRIAGVACMPGSQVDIDIDGVIVGSTTAEDDGSWEIVITVPADLSVGSHTLTATCAGQVVHVMTLVVAGSGGNPLPRTGSSGTGLLVGIGAAAVVLGVSFVYGSRSERRSRTNETV